MIFQPMAMVEACFDFMLLSAVVSVHFGGARGPKHATNVNEDVV